VFHIRQNGKYFRPDETAIFDVHLINEGKITVLIGAIRYGKGKILLAPCYHVKDGIECEAPHILQDMLFYNYIKMLGN